MPALVFNNLSIASFQAADGPLQYPYDALAYIMPFLNRTLMDNGSGVINAGGASLTAIASVLANGAGGVGYATGAGGAVTQLTSRTTGVTINKPTGQITMFSAAGSATAATFTVTNSQVAATDTISLSQASGTNLYNFLVTAVANGSFNITFFTTGGAATDAPVINFNVIKGANA